LGRGYPIEDLAQEVFIRAYPALARFEITGKAKLSTWLLSIAHRVAIDARRRLRNREASLRAECETSRTLSPEQLLDQQQLRAAIARAVDELPCEQREVFVLAEFHELTIAEIASVVGAFEATVKTRLFRARHRLRLALEPLIEG
jgi:RNA polymerase sigma-70 factor (ECF subfamily)